MDFAFCTLMVVLTATGIDGTKVVVSLPDSEPLAAMANAIETIANATKQDTNHWKTLEKKLESIQEHERESTKNLEMKLKSIEILLNKMTNGSASETESKPRQNPTPEPKILDLTAPEPEPTLPAPTEKLVKISTSETNGDGVAGASSLYLMGNGKYTPAKYAFQNTEEAWGSQAEPNYPELVWFHFHTSHKLAKIGFEGVYNLYNPKSFEVVGSNDCASWTKMLGVEDECFPNSYISTRKLGFCSWNIPKGNRQAFRCIGLKIWSIMRHDSHPYVKNIVMWEEP